MSHLKLLYTYINASLTLFSALVKLFLLSWTAFGNCEKFLRYLFLSSLSLWLEFSFSLSFVSLSESDKVGFALSLFSVFICISFRTEGLSSDVLRALLRNCSWWSLNCCATKWLSFSMFICLFLAFRRCWYNSSSLRSRSSTTFCNLIILNDYTWIMKYLVRFV